MVCATASTSSHAPGQGKWPLPCPPPSGSKTTVKFSYKFLKNHAFVTKTLSIKDKTTKLGDYEKRGEL